MKATELHSKTFSTSTFQSFDGESAVTNLKHQDQTRRNEMSLDWQMRAKCRKKRKIVQKLRKAKNTMEEKKVVEEELKVMRMHRRNLVSQWAKEQLRDKIHLDASTFETDRQKFVSHKEAVKYFGPTLSRRLLAYETYKSPELTEDQLCELQGEYSRKQLPTNGLTAHPDNSTWHTPKYQFRVAAGLSSQQPPYYQGTNGLDSKSAHVPAAHCEKYEGDHTVADSLPEESRIIEKLGHRLLWHNYNYDPFLSWTNSMLFVLVLGTARLARDQSFINIACIDTEQAETVVALKKGTKVSRKGPNRPINLKFDGGKFERKGRAKFYSAERLLRATNARCWNGWRKSDVSNLTSDWFTGEWLSHGIVLSENGSSQTRLADLLEAGLYDLHPQLLTEEKEDMKLLYDRCVRARSLAFSIRDEGQSVTMDDLQGNSDLAALFMSPEERKKQKDNPNGLTPPLHIFLSFLGLQKRVRKDHLFMQWIRDHYTGKSF